jgi:NADH-quinone oxidoreductase subunit J
MGAEDPLRSDLILACLVALFGAAGTYLLLPHRHGERKPAALHALGAILSGLALLLFALLWSPPGGLFSLSGLFFYTFAFACLAAAVLTVTSRDPTHSALWFAVVVLSSTGLFLLTGAQFLAAGTVIVYAGAIIVTFLFVIMLAQMEGRAAYDRAARMPLRTTITCFLLFLGVIWGVLKMPLQPAPEGSVNPFVDQTPLPPLIQRHREQISSLTSHARPEASTSVQEVVDRAVRPTARLHDDNGVLKPHVAGLGETLYTDHLIVVELAGALLFVALIGALSIAAPRPPVRPGMAAPTARSVSTNGHENVTL